jgi:hypothetical protein
MADVAGHEAITEILFRDASGLKLRSRKIRIEIIAGPHAGQQHDFGGPEVRLGSPRGVAAKARAALAVMASTAGTPPRYIDVRVPAAPVAG